MDTHISMKNLTAATFDLSDQAYEVYFTNLVSLKKPGCSGEALLLLGFSWRRVYMMGIVVLHNLFYSLP